MARRVRIEVRWIEGEAIDAHLGEEERSRHRDGEQQVRLLATEAATRTLSRMSGPSVKLGLRPSACPPSARRTAFRGRPWS